MSKYPDLDCCDRCGNLFAESQICDNCEPEPVHWLETDIKCGTPVGTIACKCLVSENTVVTLRRVDVTCDACREAILAALRPAMTCIVSIETLADGRTAIAINENCTHQVIIVSREALETLRRTLDITTKRRWRRGIT